MSRLPVVLVGIAFAWACALLAGAFLVPVYGTSGTGGAPNTLVGVNGSWAAELLTLPVVLVVLAGIGLSRKCHGHSHVGASLAWVAIGLLSGLSLVGIFSIGLFVLPLPAILAVAARRTIA